MRAPVELAQGLWRWTARHPDWHPGEFGREVASYALCAGSETLLIDPLLPAAPRPVLELLDGLLTERLAILVTIGYHARSAEVLWQRYRERLPTSIWGPAAVLKRVSHSAALTRIEAGAPLPGGAIAYAIGRPRRGELPLHLPSHRALAFGDSVVGVDGELRLWSTERVDERRARWYAERFAPTLAPLLELDVERILVTHGEPILEQGADALADALERPPWYHHG